MATLTDLLNEKARLEAEIAAQKPLAVAQVLDMMKTLGVTPADLGLQPAQKRVGAKRPVKYRDETGQTWTGVGQRPRWLQARLSSGATLDQFLVRPQ